jgi:hypothetical protein
MAGETAGGIQAVKAARNQALWREVNERLRLVAETSEHMEFLCVCADLDCTETLNLTVPSTNARFPIAIGHDFPEFENVVEENGSYAVVQKKSRSGRGGCEARPPLRGLGALDKLGGFRPADRGKGSCDAPLGAPSELFRLGPDGRREAGRAGEAAAPTRGYGIAAAGAFKGNPAVRARRCNCRNRFRGEKNDCEAGRPLWRAGLRLTIRRGSQRRRRGTSRGSPPGSRPCRQS